MSQIKSIHKGDPIPTDRQTWRGILRPDVHPVRDEQAFSEQSPNFVWARHQNTQVDIEPRTWVVLSGASPYQGDEQVMFGNTPTLFAHDHNIEAGKAWGLYFGPTGHAASTGGDAENQVRAYDYLVGFTKTGCKKRSMCRFQIGGVVACEVDGFPASGAINRANLQWCRPVAIDNGYGAGVASYSMKMELSDIRTKYKIVGIRRVSGKTICYVMIGSRPNRQTVFFQSPSGGIPGANGYGLPSKACNVMRYHDGELKLTDIKISVRNWATKTVCGTGYRIGKAALSEDENAWNITSEDCNDDRDFEEANKHPDPGFWPPEGI